MRKLTLTRFWFEFHEKNRSELPLSCHMGIGVTAYSIEDANSLIRSIVLNGDPLPVPSSVVSNVDISSLDQNHVLPNMNEPHSRGVWFPRM